MTATTQASLIQSLENPLVVPPPAIPAPGDIANLFAWYDPPTGGITYAVPPAVSSLAPVGGSSAGTFDQAAAALQPWTETASGLLVMRSAYDNDRMVTSLPLADWIFMHNGSGCTWFAVIECLGNDANNKWLFNNAPFDFSTRGTALLIVNGNPRWIVVNGSSVPYPVDITNAAAMALNTKYIVAGRFHSTSSPYAELWVNGGVSAKQLALSGAPSGANPWTNMTILGYLGGGFNSWNGRLVSLAFYNRYLNDAEVGGLGLWFQANRGGLWL